MNGQVWLILLCMIGGAIAIYAYHWYHRPSGMPEMLTASYAYQTLERINFQATLDDKDPEGNSVPRYQIIDPYMMDRDLNRRERDDVLKYMVKVNWLYKLDYNGTRYTITADGMRELETAAGLRIAVKEAAEALHDEGVSGEQARVAAAAVIAAALRIDARSAPSGSTEQAQASASADQMQEATKDRDLSKIAQRISMIKDIVLTTSSALTIVSEILKILGI